MNNCLLCSRVAASKDGTNPFFVAEFEHTILVIGDHQIFPGYSVLLLKHHAREPHELPLQVQSGLFAELMRAGAAVAKAFKPWKMNYSCYGNKEPHIHWHLFPRYADDSQRELPPWSQMETFSRHPTTEDQAATLGTKIRASLEILTSH